MSSSNDEDEDKQREESFWKAEQHSRKSGEEAPNPGPRRQLPHRLERFVAALRQKYALPDWNLDWKSFSEYTAGRVKAVPHSMFLNGALNLTEGSTDNDRSVEEKSHEEAEQNSSEIKDAPNPGPRRLPHRVERFIAAFRQKYALPNGNIDWERFADDTAGRVKAVPRSMFLNGALDLTEGSTGSDRRVEEKIHEDTSRPAKKRKGSPSAQPSEAIQQTSSTISQNPQELVAAAADEGASKTEKS